MKLRSLSNLETDATARRLLGAYLIRKYNGVDLIGRIVETEAYDQTDPASHTYRGETKRNRAMFGPAGHAYIYHIYGMYRCFNVTSGPDGFGAGVLIRALEPVEGIELMRANRPRAKTDTALTSGPGKLTQALAIDMDLYGHELSRKPLQCVLQPAVASRLIKTTTRIGIKEGADRLRRFYIKDSPFVSTP